MLLQINTSSQDALLRDARRADVMENPLQVRFEQHMSKVLEKIHRASAKDVNVLQITQITLVAALNPAEFDCYYVSGSSSFPV